MKGRCGGGKSGKCNQKEMTETQMRVEGTKKREKKEKEENGKKEKGKKGKREKEEFVQANAYR